MKKGTLAGSDDPRGTVACHVNRVAAVNDADARRLIPEPSDSNQRMAAVMEAKVDEPKATSPGPLGRRPHP